MPEQRRGIGFNERAVEMRYLNTSIGALALILCVVFARAQSLPGGAVSLTQPPPPTGACSVGQYVSGLNGATAPTCGTPAGTGVPSIAGTANQITESGSPGATTLSIPSDFRPPGTITIINNDLRLLGISTGYTTLTSNNPGASNYIIVLPSGSTDFSATGGTHYVLQQASTGAAITVGQLAAGDISGLGTFATQNYATPPAIGGTTPNTGAFSSLLLQGSSTGLTTFTSDNASATNYTLHIPAANDTVAELGRVQVFTVGQTINLNAAAAPSAITGTGLLINAADSVSGQVQVNSYGTIANITTARYDGTGAAPTAVQANDQLSGISVYAFDGATLDGPIASYRTYATDTITSAHWGSKACIATTPPSTITIFDNFCVDGTGNTFARKNLTVNSLTSTTGSTYSEPFVMVTGAAKDVVPVSNNWNAAFFGTNDASYPFGVTIGIAGNSNVHSRYVTFSTTAIGSSSLGNLALTAGDSVIIGISTNNNAQPTGIMSQWFSGTGNMVLGGNVGSTAITLVDNSNGIIQIPPSTSATAGLVFGNDTPQASIYRSGTSTLTMPGNLTVVGTLTGHASSDLALTGGTLSGSTTYSNIATGPILKQGANGRVGTFTCNGITPVTVSNTNVAITDAITISLNTVGGTVGLVSPTIQTITAATGFTAACQALDTSVYNYTIAKNAP